jgi:hypothetical protein
MNLQIQEKVVADIHLFQKDVSEGTMELEALIQGVQSRNQVPREKVEEIYLSLYPKKPVELATPSVNYDPFSFSPEEEKEFAAQVQIEAEMRQLESINTELLTEADDPDIVLPLVPDNPPEARLAALREVNRILTENSNQNAEETDEPEKPKFGNGLAVPMRLKGKPNSVWIDENQIDVDTGDKLNLSPEAQKLLRDKLEERRMEIANETIAQYDREREPHSYYAMTKELQTGVRKHIALNRYIFQVVLFQIDCGFYFDQTPMVFLPALQNICLYDYVLMLKQSFKNGRHIWVHD